MAFWTTLPSRPSATPGVRPGNTLHPITAEYGAGGSVDDMLGLNAPSNISYPVRRPVRGAEAWRERVENYSPWTDTFSVSEHNAQLVVDVPFEDRYLFLGKVLGFAYHSGGRVKRVNPAQHPHWSWMRASRVSHQGVRFDGSKVFVGAAAAGVAKYRLARFTIEFANYPFPFREDAELANDYDEYTRNVFWTEQPGSQVLAQEGGRGLLYYANPTGMGLTGTPGFRAPFGQIVNTVRYDLIWKWVPYDYLYVGRRPTNVVKCLNKVNLFDWAGEFPKGTMLLDSVKIVKYPAPLRVISGPALLCDVTFSMLYFDPPRGITTGTGSTIRGHNLIPYRGDHNWYPAVRLPMGGTFLPAPTDFNQLFPYESFNLLFRKAT